MNRQVWKRECLTAEELAAAKKSYREKVKTGKGRLDRNGFLIEMRLTFDEWLGIWLASGQLLNRGLRKGQYVMSRVGDIGHYQPDNVFIQLASENSREGHLGRTHSDATKRRMSASRRGRPNGKKGAKHAKKNLESFKSCRGFAKGEGTLHSLPSLP